MKSFAKYRTLRGTNILRLVRGIPEGYLCPSSRLQQLFTEQFCQMTKSCPMSNHSMPWTVSLLYLPVCRMSAHGIWLFVRTNIRKRCDEDARDVTSPKPLMQITESKDMLVCLTMTSPMQRKGRRKHEKYFMIYLWQKY